MRQVIFCGRGGQGVLASAATLAHALWKNGRYVQAFPAFRPEKKGAPAEAFVRYDNQEVWLRCEIDQADIIILLDPAVLSAADATSRLAPDGLLVVNTGSQTVLAEYRESFRIAAVDAAQIAFNHRLGTRLLPHVNFAILGALARAFDQVSLAQIQQSAGEYATDKIPEVQSAIRDAYEHAIWSAK